MHLDLKPDNILIREPLGSLNALDDLHLQITDFGLARPNASAVARLARTITSQVGEVDWGAGGRNYSGGTVDKTVNTTVSTTQTIGAAGAVVVGNHCQITI